MCVTSFCTRGALGTWSRGRSIAALGHTSTHKVRPRALRWLSAIVFGLASLYSVLGVLPALSLFRGERALWNVNLWASLALVEGVVAWQFAPKSAQSSQPSGLQRVMPWLQVALAVYFVSQVVSHLASVDACLDHGGSFDYLAGVCNTQESFPFVPLHRTHGFPIVAACVFGFLAIRSHLRLRNARRTAQSEA